MKINFNAVKLSRTISGFCFICGKKATRTITVEHTINPWNCNEDGSQKTREEVRKNVQSELEVKCAKQVKHARCRDE